MINKDIEETKKLMEINLFVGQNIHGCVKWFNEYKNTDLIDAEDYNEFYVLLQKCRELNKENALILAEKIVIHHALMYIEHEFEVVNFVLGKLEKRNDQ